MLFIIKKKNRTGLFVVDHWHCIFAQPPPSRCRRCGTSDVGARSYEKDRTDISPMLFPMLQHSIIKAGVLNSREQAYKTGTLLAENNLV